MKTLNTKWLRATHFAAISAVVLLSGCSDAGIKAAKQKTYPGHSGTTFEKVLDNYQWCKGKKWESKELKTGEKFVEFTCIATEPDVKAKIAEYLAELAAEDAKDFVKIDEGDVEFMKNVRAHAYRKQIGAAENVALDEERLQRFDAGMAYQGGSRETILYELQLSRARLASFQTPEYIAAADNEIRQAKAARDAEVADKLKAVKERGAQRQLALTDGTIKLVVQWHLNQSGGVGHYAIGVDFDFDGRAYSVEGEGRLGDSILAAVYQDVPILNGLREVLNPVAIFNAPDGMILYTLSQRTLKSGNRS